jgi:hypothetical protein
VRPGEEEQMGGKNLQIVMISVPNPSRVMLLAILIIGMPAALGVCRYSIQLNASAAKLSSKVCLFSVDIYIPSSCDLAVWFPERWTSWAPI